MWLTLGSRSATAAASAACIFALCAGASVAGSLPEDYASLVEARRALETKRHELELASRMGLRRLRERSNALNVCVGQVTYPEKVCWESPISRAGTLELELKKQRHAMEATRLALELERKELEQRRQRVEARFAGVGRGAAYEAAIRKYMDELRAHFARVEERLIPFYGERQRMVEDHRAFVDEQARSCAAGKSCDLAERYTALTNLQASVQGAESSLASGAGRLLLAAEDLWAVYTRTPRSAAVLRSDGSVSLVLEEARKDLERTRRGVESYREMLSRERLQLEHVRQQLEAVTTRRGERYENELTANYLAPMERLVTKDQELSASYRCYWYGIVAYVAAIRAAVEDGQPGLRQVAQSRFSSFAIDDALARIQDDVQAQADKKEPPKCDVNAGPSPPNPHPTPGNSSRARVLAGLVNAFSRSFASVLARVVG